MVKKRLRVPFEFRFTNQDVRLEIIDTHDNSIIYEVELPFDNLFDEAQLLDSQHLVRLSVGELAESQKMLV